MRKITIFLCLVLIINMLSGFSTLAAVMAEPAVVAGQLHVAALNIYGRVHAGGDNSYKQSLTYGWKDIISICAGKYFTAGLDKNGKVFIAGKCESGMPIDVSGLENIIQIAAGDNFLAALDANKKVYVVGSCNDIDVSSWSDIEKIACGSEHIVGLKSNGKCVGSGTPAPSDVSKYSEIVDIYAGANLTVLKNAEGFISHAGMGTYSLETGEDGSNWVCEEWVKDGTGNVVDVIKDIIITQGSAYNGVVTAVLYDGTIKTDATEDKTYWSESFLNQIKSLQNVDKLDISCSLRNPFVVVLEKGANDIYTIGTATEDPEKWKNEIKTFDVTVKPLEIIENDKVVVQARKSMAFLLPDGSVKTFGGVDLSGFVKLKNLTSAKNYQNTAQVDYYFGINEEGKIITNFTDVDLSEWHGAVEVASAKWNDVDRLVTALRWDGRLSYSTDADDTINTFDANLGKIVDIESGEYFTAGLTADKKVVLADTSGKGLDTSSWTNIEKIYAGYKHILGVDTNGNYFVTGGPTEMKTIIDTWTGMVDFACGSDYTVGLDSTGRCHFAAKSYPTLKTTIEAWTDIVKVYSGYNYVIGEKSDGTYVYAKATSTPDLTGIENVYYKDNDFLYQEKGGSKIVLDYCLENGRTAYMTFFDSSSNPVGYKKVILEGNGERVAEEYTAMGAQSSKMTFNTPLASELTFYQENSMTDGVLSVSYCSDTEKIAYVTVFNDGGEIIECKKIILPASEEYKTVTNECAEGAASYKLVFDKPLANELIFYEETLFSGNTFTVNYCSGTEKTVYITFFDAEGNAVDYTQLTLPASEDLASVQATSEENVSLAKYSYDKPLASKLEFYAQHKKEDGKIKINYCSDKDRVTYITLFDEKGLPTEYKKITLAQSEEMTETIIDCKGEYKISFEALRASDIGFYMEQKAEGGEVVINYCSDSDRKMWLAFYDFDGNLADFKTVEFGMTEEMEELRFSCNAAERYRLLLWDSLKPVYGAEGNLR